LAHQINRIDNKCILQMWVSIVLDEQYL